MKDYRSLNDRVHRQHQEHIFTLARECKKFRLDLAKTKANLIGTQIFIVAFILFEILRVFL